MKLGDKCKFCDNITEYAHDYAINCSNCRVVYSLVHSYERYWFHVANYEVGFYKDKIQIYEKDSGHIIIKLPLDTDINPTNALRIITLMEFYS